MCVRQIRTWKGSGDQVKIRVIWFQLHLLILCHCHVFRSGASCDRLALVWYLLKQTWYLDILITHCLKKQYSRPKITLPPTHSLQIGVREISICFHMEAKCFHVSAHLLKHLLLQIYTNMHMFTIKASQRPRIWQANIDFYACWVPFTSFLHIPPCWDRKIPICWSSAGDLLKVFTGKMEWLEPTDWTFQVNSQVKLIWGPCLSPIRDHTDHSVKECLGMLKIPV